MPCPVHHEIDRVRDHLRGALDVASARDTSSLSPLVRLTRRLLLRELRRYRRTGRFPKNRLHPKEMTPIFIDEEGTRCAMAHLMEVGGAASLVATVARERNFARIRELADSPELLAWLEAAGLDVDEAARIQPSYCPEAQAACVCNSSWGSPRPTATAVLEVTVVGTQEILLNNGASSPAPLARVEAIHGSTALVKVGDELPVRIQRQASAADASYAALYLVPLDSSSRLFTPPPTVTCKGPGCSDLDLDAGPPQPILQDAFAVDHGVFTGCDPAFAGQHPLTTAQIADAMLSSSCADALGKVDPAWAKVPECDRDSEVNALGCDASGGHAGASSLTLGILVAILGTIAARRRGRRLNRS